MEELDLRLEGNIRKNYIFTFVVNLNFTHGLWMIYLAFRGLSLTQIGVLEAIFHITSFLMEVPTGSVADIFGRKTSRIAGRFFSVGSILLLILSNNFYLFALSFIFSALSYNLESGAGDALIYDSMKYTGKSDKYMQTLGIQEALYQAASVASFIIGGFIGTYDYYLAFWIAAGIITSTIFYSFSFTEPPMQAKNYSLKSPLSGLIKQTMDSFMIIYTQKKIAFLMIFTETVLAFCTCIFFYIQNFWKNTGYTEFEIGIFLSIGSISAGLLGIQTHKLEKILKEKRMLIVLPLIAVLSMWGVALFKHKVVFFVAISTVESMLFVTTNDYINRLIPSRYRATIISFASMMFSFMMITIFPVFGKIADTFSFKVSFTVLATVASLMYLINMFVLSKLRETSQGEET